MISIRTQKKKKKKKIKDRFFIYVGIVGVFSFFLFNFSFLIDDDGTCCPLWLVPLDHVAIAFSLSGNMFRHWHV